MKRDAITLSLVSRSNSPPKSDIYNTVKEGKAISKGPISLTLSKGDKAVG